MPGIPRKTQLLLLKSLEAQGCTVVYKKSGYQIRCPDGITTISLHTSDSDQKVRVNKRAEIRRAGLDPWPL
jgi:hypothetical protein